MKLKKPKFVHVFTDSRGKPRNAFRRTGQTKSPLPWPMFTEKWWKAYHSALAGPPAAKFSIGASKTIPGTMNALVTEYYQSSAFTSLEPSTQATYRNQIEAFREKYGNGPVREIKTKHVDAILGEIAKKSSAQAQKLKKRLTTLFRLAVKWEYRTDNPMLNAERVKHKPKGYTPWTEDDITKFRAHWPEGTSRRIAFEILLFTGLRRSDAVRLGRQHIQSDRIVTKIKKTGGAVEVSIPIHDEFRAVLNSIGHNHLNFITTEHGAARSEKSFTNWIIEAARLAGLPPHRSPHGLRKSACIRLAEAGCSASEIMSITGHRNLAEVETYVRDANRKTLADRAIAKVYGAKLER